MLPPLSPNHLWSPAAPEPAGERLSRTRSDAPECSWAVPALGRLPCPPATESPAPLPAVLPRGQSEKEGGRNARPVPRRRRAAVPNLGPSLASAFTISVSRNRKVPVQLAPIRSCLPPPAPLPLPLPAFAPCERSLFSRCGTGLRRSGQPPRRRGMGTGLWGPSAWAQPPARSQRSGAPRAGLP